MTYSELKNYAPINWRARLKVADSIDVRKIQEWKEESAGWITCAVGNQCSVIPRYSNGRPIDQVLRRLGHEFNSLIVDIYHGKCQNIDISPKIQEAERVLHRIENRSSYLIKELKKHENKQK